ncbi:hypothetical protein AVEN_146749-1 [Araneus ventricosus]|uniref:Uncharacterized protein n=1 Tax=Araneus ventricosus TaxID=182803 RepID=A0A4Y2Q6Q9_ARAVE|nr:hypothetical protein AVEN_146749-1 [Araneus ventricosus]
MWVKPRKCCYRMGWNIRHLAIDIITSRNDIVTVMESRFPAMQVLWLGRGFYKGVPGLSSKPKTSPQKRKPPTNRNPPPDIPDAITDLIGKIRTDGFVDGVDQLLRDNMENFGKASDSLKEKKFHITEESLITNINVAVLCELCFRK